MIGKKLNGSAFGRGRLRDIALRYVFMLCISAYFASGAAVAGEESPAPSSTDIKAILASMEGTWLGTELLKNPETGAWRIGNPINLTITRVGALSDHHDYGGFAFTRHYQAPFWVFMMKDENGKEVVGTKEAINEFSPPDAKGHWRYVTTYVSTPLEGKVMEKKEVVEFSFGTYRKRYFSRPVGSTGPYELYGEFMGRLVGGE
ncbi:hypothetical protein ACFO5Q_04575 [Kordiimonas lipolytica]|uniref:DUF1579 domain-containing protein n=1 Tax=Kordiimonas lipolytica TaxID=1662421 RepID=A0ABV8U8L1_9PROT|nr:hypothetical protein [Kordiimonas lipolytica]